MIISSVISTMNPLRFKFILFIVSLVFQVANAQHKILCIERERHALLQFKAAIEDHGMLSSWTSSSDCCQWDGIRCSNLTGHILMLDLHAEYELVSARYIRGEIHTSLMELQQLRYLNLSSNDFENQHIPEFLGSMRNLRYLDLSSCLFGGKIPSQFGSLSHLKYLNLAVNSLEDSIPRQLGNLSNLHHLDLSGNHLEGNIPSQLGSLSKLQYLDLRYNSFEGNIPSQLGSLSKLQYLYLSYNSFEGNIPSQLGNLSNLQELYIGEDYDALIKIEDGGQWLSNLISLTHLSLAFISNLNTSHSWLLNIARLPKLRELRLHACSLSDHFILSSKPSEFNFSTSLSVLHLSSNTFTSSMIFPWVSNITSKLIELDLSGNLLEGGIPKSFGNTCALGSLDLSYNNLNTELPLIINHLSGCARYSLQELNLMGNQINGTLPDLSIFSALKWLDLSENQLNGKIPEGNKFPSQLESLSIDSNNLEGGIPESFGDACNLRSLDMSNNRFDEELPLIINHLSGCARYSLQKLNLIGNQINGTLPDLSIFSALKWLDLSANQLNGKIPEGNKFPSQLESLSIDSNNLEGGIPESFGDACNLRSLDMSNNSFDEELPTIIHQLSGCARYSLEELYLSMNQINGTLPDLSTFTSLGSLSLDGNKLNGEIPKDIQFPPRLKTLSMSSNSLKGELTDYHFANMSELIHLDLSDNSLLSLTFSQNWVPPFQLIYIGLRSCKIGPAFPKWLHTQNKIESLDISHAGISDMVPKWFWAKLALREWYSLNISYNNLSGIIPNFPQKNSYGSISLDGNQFEGPIPQFLRGSLILDLSKNKFSDSLSFLCANGTTGALYQLDLSRNQLSGQIPDCWSHFKSLKYLDLSHNNFSGKVPTSMGSLLDLQALLLRNNNLTGNIPFSLSNCAKLVMLDMAENRLSGPIPAWIGDTFQDLQVLSLGMNHFSGNLPSKICYLRSIQLLDLSLNYLSGKIPKCIQNFTSMAQKTSLRDYRGHSYHVNSSFYAVFQSYDLNAFLMWKGFAQTFNDKGLSLLRSIDLSSNNFSEEIPMEIENLFELVSLNLSRNKLTGKIPSKFGKLASLESLDLSRNQLVDSIPSSLTQIFGLGVLDLSHNHLSGEIPTGTQLQSFNASSYEDNLDLCGPPLEKSCIHWGTSQEPNVEVHEDEFSLSCREFYISMAIGFVISFWGVFGSILFKPTWRHAYFKILNNLSDNIYVKVAVFTNRIKGR